LAEAGCWAVVVVSGAADLEAVDRFSVEADSAAGGRSSVVAPRSCALHDLSFVNR
jgi:hypothetical protein